MMPVVRVNDSAFTSLKHIATWKGLNTPAETIDRLVREEMMRLGLEGETTSIEAPEDGKQVLIFDEAPGLSFTRILNASINGHKIKKNNWSMLLIEVIQVVSNAGTTGNSLVAELHVPAKVGRYEEEGYKYYEAMDISVQGQSASDAWRETSRLAARHGIIVIIEFQWRDNRKAEFPNRIGQMQSGK